MSTYIYLVCLDHDPPLLAEEESGQHRYDLPRIREEINNREEIVRAYEGGHSLNPRYASDWDDESTNVYFRVRSARFLARHQSCRIGIQDEYGQDHPAVEE